MKSWKLYCSGLALAAGLAPAAWAQALPGAPTAPPAVAPAAAPAAPAAPQGNIWTKLCPTPEQKAACKAKICASPLGQLLNNMLMPAGAMTGGIIGPCCPLINPADLAKPPDSVQGAAAQLQKDEAEAAARRAAIRYMAGADCHYWPEVTGALIGALRSDRNECVRLEAALALGRGCCCNRATMKALALTVSGGTEDGNPAEDSDRVKAAAMAALNHCLANYTEVVPVTPVVPVVPIKPGTGGGEKGSGEKGPETLPPPSPPLSKKHSSDPLEYYRQAENLPEKAVVEEARRAVEHMTPVAAAAAPSPAADHSLFGIARAAVNSSAAPTEAAMEKPAMQPVEAPGAAPVVTPVVAPAVMMQPSKPMTPAPVVAPAAPQANVAPVGYSTPARKPVVMPPPAPISTTFTPTAPTGMNSTVVADLIAVLHDSINPEEREKAANALGGCDGWANPNVVRGLVEAARSDAAPLVRAACLHSLTRMNIRTLPVATVAQALKTDPDPRVRSEAEQALKQIGGATAHAQ
ncbi:MAG TPA: HEAT repeat domain-containing protein [Gemmataceae bacterium]|nr:HEAT repeat domain-containing protein [Gemmataceae bacterium]